MVCIMNEGLRGHSFTQSHNIQNHALLASTITGRIENCVSGVMDLMICSWDAGVSVSAQGLIDTKTSGEAVVKCSIFKFPSFLYSPATGTIGTAVRTNPSRLTWTGPAGQYSPSRTAFYAA